MDVIETVALVEERVGDDELEALAARLAERLNALAAALPSIDDQESKE